MKLVRTVKKRSHIKDLESRVGNLENGALLTQRQLQATVESISQHVSSLYLVVSSIASILDRNGVVSIDELKVEQEKLAKESVEQTPVETTGLAVVEQIDE